MRRCWVVIETDLYTQVVGGKNPFYFWDVSSKLSIPEMKRRKELPAKREVFHDREEYFKFMSKACAHSAKERFGVQELEEKMKEFVVQSIIDRESSR